MNYSDLLSALDAEESGKGQGFVTTYGNSDITSDEIEEEEEIDDDDIIIVDKGKHGNLFTKTGTSHVVVQPPLSRKHKGAIEFDSKQLGKIPKLSVPKSTNLPKVDGSTVASFKPYQSNNLSNTRPRAQKRTYITTQTSSETPVTNAEITVFTQTNQPIILLKRSNGTNVNMADLRPGVIQIPSSQLLKLIQHKQLTAATNDTNSKTPGKHSSRSLPTKMTPQTRPVKVPASTSEILSTENDDDDDDTDTVNLALCAHCGIKSRSLVKCDSCKCDFSVKKYRKLIPVPKEEMKTLNNESWRSFVNKKKTVYLPVKRQSPPSTVSSSNWKESYRLKTPAKSYPARRPRKQAVQPVCISISSDEEEPMSQDEETSNGVNSDDCSLPAVFNGVHSDDCSSPAVFDSHKKKSNGSVESDSDESELKPTSHHRLDDTDSGSGYNTPVKKKIKNKMRNQNGELPCKSSEKVLKDDLPDCNLEKSDITAQNGLRLVSFDATLIRIGSKEYTSCTSVDFQWNKIVLNLNDTSSLMQLELKTVDLVSCVYYTCDSKFSIFFQTVPAVGLNIRSRLKMNKTSWYDPGSSDQSKKTINIHANKLTENKSAQIRKLIESYQVTNKDLQCLEVAPNNIDNILEKYKPTTEVKVQKEKSTFEPDKFTSTSSDQRIVNRSSSIVNRSSPIVNRSSPIVNRSSPIVNRSSPIVNRSSPIQQPLQLIYPPNESKGRISVTSEDLSCLEDGEFINDVIIDFYLKYLLHEVLSEEVRERTHIFSSFFYKRLSKRVNTLSKFELGPHKSVPERRHSHVKSWTRNIDLFQKDFIVIPVNESAHWYVAIVCFPGLVKPAMIESNIQQSASLTTISITDTSESDNPEVISSSLSTNEEETEESNNEEEKMEQNTESVEEDDKQNNSKEEDCKNRGSENNRNSTETAEQNQVTSPTNIQEPIKSNKELDAANNVFHTHQSYEFKQPCILIFDSLKGTSKRNTCINKLKEYLTVEWKIRKGKNRDFDFKGMQPDVPQQSNYHDCGVYLLQYVESFFTLPINNYSSPLRGLSEWFTEDKVNCKRDEIKKLISQLSEQNKR
ncbi:uncharacterized protein [Antedon mediterranea]|uniref:uncharacterized protein n=1 Tax=Antedon mediterranea TaxID=105859 RepID=UPI003AF665D9